MVNNLAENGVEEAAETRLPGGMAAMYDEARRYVEGFTTLATWILSLPDDLANPVPASSFGAAGKKRDQDGPNGSQRRGILDELVQHALKTNAAAGGTTLCCCGTGGCDGGDDVFLLLLLLLLLLPLPMPPFFAKPMLRNLSVLLWLRGLCGRPRGTPIWLFLAGGRAASADNAPRDGCFCSCCSA